MAMDWKVALPLHPEYRTLPMVWYVPPLSPISAAANAGQIGANGEMPDVTQPAHPGAVPGQPADRGRQASRSSVRSSACSRCAPTSAASMSTRRENLAVLQQVGLSQAEVEEMYQIMAIANYEDRFVIPTTHREYAENAFDLRGGCGFSFGNGCSDGQTETSLFGGKKRTHDPDQGHRLKETATMLTRKTPKAARYSQRALAALLRYPDADPARGAARSDAGAARRSRDRRAPARRDRGPGLPAGGRRPLRSRSRLRRNLRPQPAQPRCICSSMCTATRATVARR